MLQVITVREHRFKLTQIRVAMRKLVRENFTVTAQSYVKCVTVSKCIGGDNRPASSSKLGKSLAWGP